jgi:CDP-diacylglycerol--glycerol-3-phosphate 3-phosphatidyltransferase
VFAGLVWWAAYGLHSAPLVVATLICLVTSQVISYIKARAEASGLRGGGGLIERQERLSIVLIGTGLSDLPFFPLPWTLHVAMWVLAVASVLTLLQRLHTVRTSPGAMEPLQPSGDKPEASEP